MSQKQGGKGKQSSQSDKNYWARIKLSGTDARKARKKARHIRRMGVNLPASAFDPSPVFPKRPLPRPVSRVIDTSIVPEGVLKKLAIYPIYQVISRCGVLLDSSFEARLQVNRGQGEVLIRQFPSGRREVVL